MKKYFRILANGLLMFAGSLAICGPSAEAAQQLVLVTDQSQMIKLAEPPATVVVGNPAVADVTTDGSSLFFHPRTFGLTNVIALDGQGKKLGEFMVSVVYEDSYGVTMYSPQGRKTYACRSNCEPALRIGDSNTFFSESSSQASTRDGLSTSQALGEDTSSQGSQGSTVVRTGP